jgi:hypothetical protein
MAANTSPVFGIIPVMGYGETGTANTNRDGTGTIVDLLTGDTDGTRVDMVTIKNTVTTTAGMIRFYLHNGAAYQLLHEENVTALTPSGTVQAFEATWIPARPWILPSGYKLAFSTHNAENVDVCAHGCDLS